MPDATRLDNQVAIVTGAARGIGRGIALVLAEAGASIVIGDLLDSSETVRLVEDLEGKAVSMQMDTSRPQDAQALVDLALNTFGRLDILVNDAGIDAPDGNAWDLPDEEWTRVIDVNLSGVFYCSKAALQPMLKVGSGAIVNISSQSARIGSKGMSPAYNTSKAGVLGLTMAFSAHVADKGVRVNAVTPGLVRSKEFGWSKEEDDGKTAEYPLGLGAPRDIGEAVRYLASPASRWVSGTALHIAGGYQKGASWF